MIEAILWGFAVAVVGSAACYLWGWLKLTEAVEHYRFARRSYRPSDARLNVAAIEAAERRKMFVSAPIVYPVVWVIGMMRAARGIWRDAR